MTIDENKRKELLQRKKELLIKKRQMLADLPREKSVLDKIDQSGDSPLDATQRVATSFGNVNGIVDYLKKQGFKPKVLDDEIYVETEKGLAPIDPGMFKGGLSELSKDISEFAATVPEMAISSAGSFLGGLGGAVSTGNPVGAYLGQVAGGGIGSGAAEKYRQALGKMIGSYQPENDDFINSDVKTAALIGAGTDAVLPLVGQGLKQTSKLTKPVTDFTSKKLKDLARNVYLHSTGMNKLVGFKENQLLPDAAKEAADELIKGGFFGTEDTLADMASSSLKDADNQLVEELSKSKSKIGFKELMDESSKIAQSNVPEVAGEKGQNKVISYIKNILNDSRTKSQFKPTGIKPDTTLKNEAEKIIDALEIDLPTANKLKRSFNSSFAFDEDASMIENAEMGVQSALRKMIENKSIDPEKTKQLNKSMVKYLMLKKGLMKDEAIELARPVFSRSKGYASAISDIPGKASLITTAMDAMPKTAVGTGLAKIFSMGSDATGKISKSKLLDLISKTAVPVSNVTSQLTKQIMKELSRLDDVDEEQFNKKRNKSNVD